MKVILFLEVITPQDVIANSEMVMLDLFVVKMSGRKFDFGHGVLDFQMPFFEEVKVEGASCVIVGDAQMAANGGEANLCW